LLSLFLFAVRRPPPPSTLFPYTTLFRSRLAGARPLRRAALFRRRRIVLLARRDQPGHGAADRARLGHHLAVLQRRRQQCAHPDGDRKSTRLNSSHVKISYAVFCLKKKKK